MLRIDIAACTEYFNSLVAIPREARLASVSIDLEGRIFSRILLEGVRVAKTRSSSQKQVLCGIELGSPAASLSSLKVDYNSLGAWDRTIYKL